VHVCVEYPRQPRRERIDLDSAFEHSLDVGDRVGESEGDLLDSGRAGLPHVVAGKRDRVEPRRLSGAPRDQIGRKTKRWLWRVYEGAARYVLLEHVVLRRPGDLVAYDALLVG